MEQDEDVSILFSPVSYTSTSGKRRTGGAGGEFGSGGARSGSETIAETQSEPGHAH